jgi:hypothetical protein
MSFSADGRYLIGADEAGDVTVWTLDVDAVLQLAQMRVSRELTPDEWAHYFPGRPRFPAFPTQNQCPELILN